MDDLYGGGDEVPMEKPVADAPDKDSGKTFLINAEVCPGMKQGDEMVLRIVRVLEGEYETEYSPEKPTDESGSSPEPKQESQMASGVSGMFD